MSKMKLTATSAFGRRVLARMNTFLGNLEAGQQRQNGSLILGNFKKMRDAHLLAAEKGAIVIPYLNGKFPRGWIVQTIERIETKSFCKKYPTDEVLPDEKNCCSLCSSPLTKEGECTGEILNPFTCSHCEETMDEQFQSWTDTELCEECASDLIEKGLESEKVGV